MPSFPMPSPPSSPPPPAARATELAATTPPPPTMPTIITADLALADPPPPYPSPRRTRRRVLHPQPGHTSENSAEGAAAHHAFPSTAAADETTPLLSPSLSRRPARQRTMSGASTIRSTVSRAPSLAHTVASLFADDDSDDDGCHESHPRARDPEVQVEGSVSGSPMIPGQVPRRPTLYHWKKYWRPLVKRKYWAALFHLLVLNLPYAVLAWVYLFVFTVAGTALLITLPLGAVLCFFDLLGARALARGELALQSTFHGPLAFTPHPPLPIFTRLRERPLLPTSPSELEAGNVPYEPVYETSFYRNSYSMFTDSTSYRALFYFLVIKASITLLMSILLVIFVPLSLVLIAPAPAMLRAVRRVGIWQANVAIEGLYIPVS